MYEGVLPEHLGAEEKHEKGNSLFFPPPSPEMFFHTIFLSLSATHKMEKDTRTGDVGMRPRKPPPYVWPG
jgi:hypothetical protein